MKRTINTISIVLLLVAAAKASAQDYQFPSPPTPDALQDASVVGDEAEFVGDLDFAADNFVGDLTPVNRFDDDSVVGDLEEEVESVATDSEPMPMPAIDTVTDAQLMPITSAISSPIRSVSYSRSASPSKWLRAESLLWFADNRDTPPLVLVGPGRTNAFGNPIDSGLAPGFRVDYGHYFGNGTYGVGVKFWGLFGEDEEYNRSGTGPGDIIERPFFDTNGVGGPAFDALIVSGLGPTSGTFTAKSELDMIATEAYGRINFDTTSTYRIDLIGGFTSFAIDDYLSLRSNSVQLPLESTFVDIYDAENHFYGGQLGLESMFKSGKWSLTTLSKVHLGNMNQRVEIRGSSTSAVFPNPPGPATDFANGFYVQGQQGNYENDEFAFAPELGIRLGYSPRKNVEFTLGYSFIYWSSVALAGDQLNPALDSQLLLTNTPGAQAANYSIREDGFWLQGIDLGISFNY